MDDEPIFTPYHGDGPKRAEERMRKITYRKQGHELPRWLCRLLGLKASTRVYLWRR